MTHKHLPPHHRSDTSRWGDIGPGCAHCGCHDTVRIDTKTRRCSACRKISKVSYRWEKRAQLQRIVWETQKVAQ